VDHPPPAVRLDTRISDVATKLRTALCPSFSGVFYMHCGRAGQAECGRNLAAGLPIGFKQAFEIDNPRIGGCC